MDVLRIAGNEDILNDWVADLINCNLIASQTGEDGRVVYTKTHLGDRMHEVLRAHLLLGPLLSDLSRNRRRPK